MKKWFEFFGLSFFSDRISKGAAKRGYANVLLGLILALVFIWAGFVGGDMLPFSVHYNNSTDFKATVHSVLANPDADKRVIVEIDDGDLKAKKQGGEYAESLLVNTYENDTDKQNYSKNGYNVVIDSRPADALAEVEAYCLSNDGQNLEITYEEYLSLSAVAKLNFDFKLRYTGDELVLTDTLVDGYRSYLDTLSSEIKLEAEKISSDLEEEKITKNEYNRAIYKLYFTNYYPSIDNYESSSEIPLLRNYYYHQYISTGIDKYLFMFDDYMAGSFETDGGIDFSFYGFYGDLENGTLIAEGASQAESNTKADNFIKKSFGSILFLTLYAYAMNVFSFIPFIALMPMVVTLLAYSILKLRGVESITSLGGTFKIIGSYMWFSSALSAVLTVIIAFFVPRNIITVLPIILFFVTLAVRSIIFAINETRLYMKQLENATQTED